MQKIDSFTNSQCVDLAGNAFNGYVAMAVTATLIGSYDWVAGSNIIEQNLDQELEQILEDEHADANEDSESEADVSEAGTLSLFGSMDDEWEYGMD